MVVGGVSWWSKIGNDQKKKKQNKNQNLPGLFGGGFLDCQWWKAVALNLGLGHPNGVPAA